MLIWFQIFCLVARKAIKTEHNQDYDTISVHHSGAIQSQTRRETFTMSCDFDVRKFPYDEQNCDIIIEAVEQSESENLHMLCTLELKLRKINFQ